MDSSPIRAVGPMPPRFDVETINQLRQNLLSIDEKMRWIEYVDEAAMEHATMSLANIELELQDINESPVMNPPDYKGAQTQCRLEQQQVNDLKHQYTSAQQQLAKLRIEVDNKKEVYEHVKLLHYWCHCATDTLKTTERVNLVTVNDSQSLVNEVVDELADRSAQAEYLRKAIPTIKLKPIERNRVRDKLDRIQLRLADIRRIATARDNYLKLLIHHMSTNKHNVPLHEQLATLMNDPQLKHAQHAAHVQLVLQA